MTNPFFTTWETPYEAPPFDAIETGHFKPAFIAALAGLAMLRVLQTAFQASFNEKFSLGALVCFLVTVADVPVFNIGAPFWGIVFGLAASWLLERDDHQRDQAD